MDQLNGMVEVERRIIDATPKLRACPALRTAACIRAMLRKDPLLIVHFDNTKGDPVKNFMSSLFPGSHRRIHSREFAGMLLGDIGKGTLVTLMFETTVADLLEEVDDVRSLLARLNGAVEC